MPNTPSRSRIAPQLPASVSAITKRRPLFQPLIAGKVTPPSPAAPTRPGTICANTPISVSIARQPTIARAATAAGSRGFTIVPSGRMISSGRR